MPDPMNQRVRETELFAPVREYLLSQGYRVDAEVKDCDIVASQGDDLVIVELKSGANLKLLIQATDRQTITDAVYVAVPQPAQGSRHFRGVERLLKRLGLGLIIIRFTPFGATAEKRFDPQPGSGRRRGKRRHAVVQEIAGRTETGNIGGSNRTTIMTAYRETALFIACCLNHLGPCSTRQLRALGGGDKVTTILAKNYHGWFERVERGTYRLTCDGADEVHRHPALMRRCLDLISEQDSLTD